jgi:hypothetical protein
MSPERGRIACPPSRYRERMIRIAQTRKGMLVFALQGGWGDWYQVALFDQHLAELASDEDELQEETGLAASLVDLGLPEAEAQALAAQWVPDPPQRRSWSRFRRASKNG